MSLERGIRLFNQGRYWDAHEAWEEAWTLDRTGPDRAFYKGLIQIAAGCLHYQRGNRRGTVNKWGGGAAYLRPLPESHHGVRVGELVCAVEKNLACLDGPAWPELILPVIQVDPVPPA
ncbi:MAG: DUF309 domain-containing protein [Candidatus Dormibacteraeota bacterium]|nr:DUF309 domain-containing protein [Candidatus Dormibacteraeota bacterium]